MQLVMSLSPIELVKEGLCLTKDLQPAVRNLEFINVNLDEHGGCNLSIKHDECQRDCIKS